MNARVQALSFVATVKVDNQSGILFIYDTREPDEACLKRARELARSAVPIQGVHDSVAVALPTPFKGALARLSALGKVTRLNSTHTLFQVKAWRQEFAKGCLVIDNQIAAVRPFYPKETWEAHRGVGTVLIRGPVSIEEILDRWHKLSEIVEKDKKDGTAPRVSISLSKSGKTWLVRSPLRKRDAKGLQPWTVIASGHCFCCGRPRHTERDCPNRKSKCRICNSPYHTAEVCDARDTALKVETALVYVNTVRSFLKSFRKGEVLPKEVGYFLGKAAAAVRNRKSRGTSGREVGRQTGQPQQKQNPGPRPEQPRATQPKASSQPQKQQKRPRGHPHGNPQERPPQPSKSHLNIQRPVKEADGRLGAGDSGAPSKDHQGKVTKKTAQTAAAPAKPAIVMASKPQLPVPEVAAPAAATAAATAAAAAPAAAAAAAAPFTLAAGAATPTRDQAVGTPCSPHTFQDVPIRRQFETPHRFPVREYKDSSPETSPEDVSSGVVRHRHGDKQPPARFQATTPLSQRTIDKFLFGPVPESDGGNPFGPASDSSADQPTGSTADPAPSTTQDSQESSST